MADIYERLAAFLDDLPAGFPRSESGVELRILRKLFTPAEAELCSHLTMLDEEPRVIAFRAHQPVESVREMLEAMEQKGLISGQHEPGKPDRYSASQFVVGIYEDQVNHLDAELVDLFEEYSTTLFTQGPWKTLPQMRTIPVGVSIPVPKDVMPYEQAEEIVKKHTRFAVRNCVCRQEQTIAGHGCEKPLETCLSFGGAADYTIRMGRGRAITQDEALGILRQAEDVGLVLQPSNSQDPIFICACCGCCCGVLRGLKMMEHPGQIASNRYIAAHDPDLCSGCGTCTTRCQMGAITLPNGTAELDQDRCIGCGLCVSTCPTGALTLTLRPVEIQAAIPKDTLSTYIQLGLARKTWTNGTLVQMAAKSKIDRLRAPR